MSILGCGAFQEYATNTSLHSVCDGFTRPFPTSCKSWGWYEKLRVRMYVSISSYHLFLSLQMWMTVCHSTPPPVMNWPRKAGKSCDIMWHHVTSCDSLGGTMHRMSDYSPYELVLHSQVSPTTRHKSHSYVKLSRYQKITQKNKDFCLQLHRGLWRLGVVWLSYIAQWYNTGSSSLGSFPSDCQLFLLSIYHITFRLAAL